MPEKPEAKWRWDEDGDDTYGLVSSGSGEVVISSHADYDYPSFIEPSDEARAAIPWTPNLLALVRGFRDSIREGDESAMWSAVADADALLAAIDGEGGAA